MPGEDLGEHLWERGARPQLHLIDARSLFLACEATGAAGQRLAPRLSRKADISAISSSGFMRSYVKMC